MQTRPSGFLLFPVDLDRPNQAEAAPMAELAGECKGGFAATGDWRKGFNFTLVAEGV